MTIPTDTMLNQQWHLGNGTPGQFDLNVRTVWNDNYTGAGIRVNVIDNAFDYTHTDLAPNFDTFLDYDFAANDLDTFGADGLNHGTAVAGIIGADNNGTGVVGVAFDSSIVGYQTADLISDAWLQDIRDALHHSQASSLADVVNISQGIANDITSIFGIGYNAARFTEIATAIGECVDLGRGGLGISIVKSAGNSRNDGSDAGAVNDLYDVNADPWTKDTRQIVVAAVDRDGTISSYSSFGAPNLVSAFGTPGQVVTTDRVGGAGYSGTDFTTTFNGTSAAAPMVAGVVSLMLDANAGLGWRDVQNILSYSARHVGSAVDGVTTDGIERTPWDWNGANNWNGGGLHFSNDYGYGLVDATAAVRLAETWLLMDNAQTSGNQGSSIQDGLDVATIIPDGNLAGTTFNLNEAFAVEVERVTLTLNFSTTYLADVEVYLTSPSGTVSELIRDITAGNATQSSDFNGTWTFESQAFRGESSVGTWSVRIVDDAGADVLTVSDIVLRTYGHVPSTDDNYIFTNEYSVYDGVGGHSTAIADLNGGNDWVNAAAVTSASTINLAGGASNIDGVALTLTNIENAIGGDGGDVITGNGAVNILYGMRGSDIIDGGAGADDMFGGAGDDIYYVNSAADEVFETVGNGNDRVLASVSYTLAAGQRIETLDVVSSGGTTAINLTGNGFANTILGNAGINILDGGGSSDVMRGFGGDDTYYVNVAGDQVFETAGAGNDRVLASANYTLAAGQSIETLDVVSSGGLAAINLTGNELVNTVLGNAGHNILDGGGSSDVIRGFGGNDIYYVDNNGDWVFENVGEGSDRVLSYVNFTLTAGQAIETLDVVDSGGLAGINLIGNEFANTILGNAGSNVLGGRGGSDTLTGLGGSDTFLFDSNPAGGIDIITDFSVAQNDNFLLNDSDFGGMAVGMLAANAFFIGAAAGNSEHRIVYNSATGALFFDADGTGGTAAIQFATLGAGLALANNDFFIA